MNNRTKTVSELKDHLLYGVTANQERQLDHRCPLAGETALWPLDDRLTLVVAKTDPGYLLHSMAQRALAYDHALRIIHQQIDILPFQYSGPQSLEIVTTTLSPKRDELLAKSQQLAGTVQMNFRWRVRSVVEASGRTSAALSGTDYLKRRHQAQAADPISLSDLRAKTLTQSEVIACEVARVRMDNLHQLVGLDCLVQRIHMRSFHSAMKSVTLNQRLPDHISDPLPPFRFIYT